VTNSTVADPPDLNERTLVRELTHRINDQLASAINVVTAAAVRAEHPETKVALGNVTELLQEQANVTGLMRRLRLTPMAGPTPRPTTAATTCPHTGDTAPGAFWCVMETD
jgi:hypothetical protein